MTTEKTFRIAGRMGVGFQIDLPASYATCHVDQPDVWDDPAKEAAAGALHQHVTLWLMGGDAPPTEVWLEVTTDDVDIEEDGRLCGECDRQQCGTCGGFGVVDDGDGDEVNCEDCLGSGDCPSCLVSP